MSILIGVVVLFLVLVTFHEYGHYSVARYFKIKILKFSIGFGPDLINWKNKDGIKFSLSALPFGGYVAFHDPSDISNYNQLSNEDKKYVLANRPALEKSLVTLAGPFFNFVLAFVIFAFVGLFMPRESDVASAKLIDSNEENIYRIVNVNSVPIKNAQELEIELFKNSGFTGRFQIDLFDYENQREFSVYKDVNNLSFPQDQSPSSFFNLQPLVDYSPFISSVSENSIAFQSGLRKGDLITAINDKNVFSVIQANNILNQYDQRFYISVIRGEDNFSFVLPAKIEGEFFGISLIPDRNTFYDSVTYGFDQTLFWISNTFKFLIRTFTGSLSLDNLSGPVGIAKVAGDSLSSGFIPYLLLLAILSISLGAFNLLPLPMLDGGQFLFILVEELKGSPINLKLKVVLFNLSYLLIMALTIYVIINDVGRII
tara:strand:+ start:128 stop:1411 length:1284 start_codon:yes stop_codon:yes gene_type:complete